MHFDRNEINENQDLLKTEKYVLYMHGTCIFATISQWFRTSSMSQDNQTKKLFLVDITWNPEILCIELKTTLSTKRRSHGVSVNIVQVTKGRDLVTQEDP